MAFEGLINLWNTITGVTAANKASEAQLAGIADARSQFDPYAAAGQSALAQQMELMNNPEAVANSPMFQGLVAQGEDALLQNAAATGGLRGGNTAGALAQFRPQMLNSFIQQRFNNLGGIAGMGYGAAGNIAGLATDAGNVRASNELAGYEMQRNFVGDVAGFGLQLGGMLMGMPPIPGMGGGSSGNKISYKLPGGKGKF